MSAFYIAFDGVDSCLVHYIRNYFNELKQNAHRQWATKRRAVNAWATTATGLQNINQIKIHQLTRQIDSVVLSFCKIKNILLLFVPLFSIIFYYVCVCVFAARCSSCIGWLEMTGVVRLAQKPSTQQWLCISIWWNWRHKRYNQFKWITIRFIISNYLCADYW